MEISTQNTPLSTFRILRESIKLLAKGRTLLVSIFLLDLLSSCLLYFLDHLSIFPLFSDLVRSVVLTDPYAIRKDTRELIIIQSVFQIAAFVISSVIAIAAIHVLACKHASSGDLPTPMDVLSKLRRTFRGPMITKLYIGIFHLGYSSLALLSVVVLFLFYSPNSAPFIVSSVIQGLVVLLLLSYLAVVWYVSVVISVVQEGCYGLVAIGKAAKLVGGRRMQGTFLIFIEMAAITILHVSYFRLIAYFHRSSSDVQLALGFVYVGIYSAMNMIVWATSTIFYYECTRTHGKNTETPMDGKYAYASLSTTSAKLLSEDKC